jgi:sensor domain CHASE-containing protein
MKRILAILLLLAVCGCGVEAVGTAATGASMKKQELKEGKKTMQRVENSIEQMNLQSADRLRDADDE